MMAWLKDTESRLKMINQPYADACGHTVEECIGKTDLDLFPDELATGFMADDREVCSSGQKMETIGQLAGGVAHDFNNMLGVIIGYSELILEETSPSHQFHAELEEIQKAARRSADLTRQLLTFSRKQTVAPKVLDLNQTVEGMLNMLRRLIGEKINLIYDLHPPFQRQISTVGTHRLRILPAIRLRDHPPG